MSDETKQEEEKVAIIINFKELPYNLNSRSFYDGKITNIDALRYLKGQYTNKARFKARFIDPVREIKTKKDMDGNLLTDFECDDMLDEMLDNFSKVKPYSYVEAFKIESQEFKALVFGSINITEMIKELCNKRIATDGIKVKHKQFKPNGDFIGHVEYDNIYEVHEVSGEKLSIAGNLYVLKCWCTSTNKEHWLWIDEKHKDKPLEAVASTFVIHENLIPHIKELKRQGDILLVEMTKDVEPEGELVSLSAEQYFGLLTCQS